MTYRHTRGERRPLGRRRRRRLRAVGSGCGPRRVDRRSASPTRWRSRAASWRATSAARTSAYGIAPAPTARYDVGPTTLYVRGLYRVVGSTTERDGRDAARRPPSRTAASPRRRSRTRSACERSVGRDSSLAVRGLRAADGRARARLLRGRLPDGLRQRLPARRQHVRQYKATIQQRLIEHARGHRHGALRLDRRRRRRREPARATGSTSNAGTSGPRAPRSKSCRRRTGVAVLVRGIRQDLQTPVAVLANDSDKLALSVAQDLSDHRPDARSAPTGSCSSRSRTARGTGLSENKDDDATTNRLLGGVAVAF